MSGIISIPIYDDSQSMLPVSGNTAYGYYDADPFFTESCMKFTTFAYRRLGGLTQEIELSNKDYYTAFEDAVNVYGSELYEYKIRENYLSLEGSTTGSNLNTTLIQPNLGNIIRLAKDYGSETGVGGNVTYYSGSLALKGGQQYYDLDYWASQSASIAADDSIEVKRIFYEASPAINRFFDPFAGTGAQLNNLMDAFGFGSYSPGVNFMLMPMYYDVLKVQAIEFNDQIRKSAFSFEIQNNKLRIMPVPAFDRPLWFTYIKNSERNAASRNSSDSLITNVSNVPYTTVTYSQINGIGQQWIKMYALANCKETLGQTRGKHNNQPYPGTEISINGSTLIEQAGNEKEKLITQLRDTLDATSRSKQLEIKQQEAQAMQDTLRNVPMAIIIG